MKRFIIGLAAILFLAGALFSAFWLGKKQSPSVPCPSPTLAVPLLGGDRDEHGCIGSAGYSWCAGTGRCQRLWEEPCP